MKEESSLLRFTHTAERAANQVIDAYSTSFGLATRMLGPRHRQHVRNIYALVRVADELVDGMSAQAGLTPSQQAETLELFIAETGRAVRLGCSSDLVIHAFAHTARLSAIDDTLITPFFDSMRTDLRSTESETAGLARFDAVAHADYVYGSAEVVGLMCLRVFMRESCPDAQTLEILEHGAKRLGAAFQNINFLRDLADDTERLGRSYLGTTDRLTDTDRLNWVQTIREQLADATTVIPLLPRDARAAVRSALSLFASLTDRVEASSIDALYRRRVRVPNPVKATLAARALTTSWMEKR